MKERYKLKTGRFGTYVFDNQIDFTDKKQHEVDNLMTIELLNKGNLAIEFIRSLATSGFSDLYKGFLLNNFNCCDRKCQFCKFAENCDGSPEGSLPDEFKIKPSCFGTFEDNLQICGGCNIIELCKKQKME